MKPFRSRHDFEAFQRCLVQTLESTPMRVMAYCVMSDHWHLVLWPERDGDLAKFMMRLTITHVRRWLVHRGEVGSGHVYQGRYKSFAMANDDHPSTVCRYVERNPVRARLVQSCRDWSWSSAGQERLAPELRVPLAGFPGGRRRDWVEWTDHPQTAAEEAAVVRCMEENLPFGGEKWLEKFKVKLGWREPMPRGRPRKRGKAK